MQLHELKRNTRRKKIRVGRGGKRGKTSGRGHKGQKARGTPRPAIRDVIKKIPKRRGYSFKSIKAKSIVINLGLIDKKFNSGEIVSPATLLSKKVLNFKKGSIVNIKILSMGEINKKIIVERCLVSEKAVEKIKKAGGEIKLMQNANLKVQNDNVKIKKGRSLK